MGAWNLGLIGQRVTSESVRESIGIGSIQKRGLVPNTAVKLEKVLMEYGWTNFQSFEDSDSLANLTSLFLAKRSSIV